MKKILYDTSVIIAGTFEDHDHFSVAFPWHELARRQRISAFISTHSVAEIFATLTTQSYVPFLPRDQVEEILFKDILPCFQPVVLSPSDYKSAIGRALDRSLRGGVIYDSLHIQAAIKKKVDALVTLNSKDFTRLIEPAELRIINPADEAP